MTTSNLYQRLGGPSAIDRVVRSFYDKVLADDRIRHFFTDVEMERQIGKQRAFLAMVFGGPVKYTGKDLRDGHAHLVARGLRNEHFDAVVELLGRTLAEAGVEADDVAEVAAIATSTRDDILAGA